MQSSWLRIVLCAFICGLVGLLLYHSQAGHPDSMMNPLGVVSFAAIGACVGCVATDLDSKRR